MQFDLTALTTGQVAFWTALVTLVGSLLVAIITAVGASVTAWVNGRNSRRLEYLKYLRESKLKQSEPLRTALDSRIAYYLALRSGTAPRALTAPSSSVYFPPYLLSDKRGNKLIDATNRQQKKVRRLIEANPDSLPRKARVEVHNLLQLLITLHHHLEMSVIRDDVDPTRWIYRLRLWIESSMLMKLRFRKRGVPPAK